jgi:hypothetical protein
MSDYLVNLARRSVGIAPVARPRSGPGPGPIAGVVRGVEQPSPSSSPVRGGPGAGTDSMLRPGSLRSIGVEPSHDEAERAHGVARVVDAPTTRIAPGQQVPTGSGPSSPVRTTSPTADRLSPIRRDPDPDQNRPAIEPRRDDLTVDLPLPAWLDGPRRIEPSGMTLIEPALVPAPLGGPRTVLEDRGPGRDVHVRIGTIEIHAESDTPPPTSLPPAAAPAVAAVPQGGFDEFVRLRSYAPWER